MTHLLPNHRIRVPNLLAVFAALVLLVSSVVGYETSLDVDSSGQSMAPSSNVESAEEDGSNDAARHQHRGLKLGLLLFRRG
ncbi:MAG: hypothetical protein GQ538_12770 [Xanthomonadales bacterium]|nr:hypothetical protein [Xanthomonadales bacterium]